MLKQCGFIGAREVYCVGKSARETYITAKKLITDDNVTVFWTGIIGVFANEARNMLYDLKEEFPHISVNIVIPEFAADDKNYRYIIQKSDKVKIISETGDGRVCDFFKECNRYIASISDYIICYALGNNIKDYISENKTVYNIGDK
ncbi:MAG: hypothetical protein IKV88_00690 [Clostridia bacterium]|nr:hypothetical protein [Clostridia bacterium]